MEHRIDIIDMLDFMGGAMFRIMDLLVIIAKRVPDLSEYEAELVDKNTKFVQEFHDRSDMMNMIDDLEEAFGKED